MDWKQLLGSITTSVDEELRLRNAYLAAENRILRQQIGGRVPLTDGDRKVLAEIGQHLGKKALEEMSSPSPCSGGEAPSAYAGHACAPSARFRVERSWAKMGRHAHETITGTAME